MATQAPEEALARVSEHSHYWSHLHGGEDVVRLPWSGLWNEILYADANKAVWGNGYKNAG